MKILSSLLIVIGLGLFFFNVSDFYDPHKYRWENVGVIRYRYDFSHRLQIAASAMMISSGILLRKKSNNKTEGVK